MSDLIIKTIQTEIIKLSPIYQYNKEYDDLNISNNNTFNVINITTLENNNYNVSFSSNIFVKTNGFIHKFQEYCVLVLGDSLHLYDNNHKLKKGYYNIIY